MNYKAVIWDFGGVITSSPFEAFNKFELDNNLPKDIIRTINSENPDDNAWAKFERNDIDINEFDTLFSKEADKKGFQISGKHTKTNTNLLLMEVANQCDLNHGNPNWRPSE